MKNRFLGLIYLLYSGIIIYVILTDKLKNFLAPKMQIYIKLAVIPMIIIGLITLIKTNKHYKFKFSDLLLLLPLIILMFASDGRLTSSFANNRTNNFDNRNKYQSNSKNESKEKKNEEEKKDIEEIKEKNIKIDSNVDFTNPYFDITDNIYNEVSNYLSYVEKATKFEGKTIKVRGFILKNIPSLTDDYYAIGKYAITCCAADAGFTGFIVKKNDFNVISNKWYEIEGILESGTDKEKNTMMYINIVNIKEINSKKEEQYVYPCYSYDNDACGLLVKYDLEY